MLAVYLVNIVNVWHSKLLFIGKKQQAIPPYNVFLPSCKKSQWEKSVKAVPHHCVCGGIIISSPPSPVGRLIPFKCWNRSQDPTNNSPGRLFTSQLPQPTCRCQAGTLSALCCSQSPFLICTLMCALRANAEILLYWSLLQSVGIKDLTSVLKQIVGCAYICLQLNNIDLGYWSQGVL